MLDAFFNIKYKGNNWFDGLAIKQYPEYDDHKNAFPVIRMDMKDVRVGTWETFLKSFGSVVRSAFLSYRDLTDEDTPDYYVTFCQEILDRHSEEELLEDSLKTLAYLLRCKYG